MEIISVLLITVLIGATLCIANVVGQTADEIFAHDSGQLDIAMVWLGILCYSLQIYFDFSGYSDIAIGLSRLLVSICRKTLLILIFLEI